jgi:hypothetical protein
MKMSVLYSFLPSGFIDPNIHLSTFVRLQVFTAVTMENASFQDILFSNSRSLSLLYSERARFVHLQVTNITSIHI